MIIRLVSLIHEGRRRRARAIQDEYRAEAIYQGVLNDFGQAPPFANVIGADERHSASIAPGDARTTFAWPASRSSRG